MCHTIDMCEIINTIFLLLSLHEFLLRLFTIWLVLTNFICIAFLNHNLAEQTVN